MSAVTAFQQVAEALAAALLAAPALAGGRVRANATRPWPKEAASGIVVRTVNARREAGMNCGKTWVVEFSAEIEARAPAGVNSDPADAVDSLLAAVATRFEAADLAPLGVMRRLPEESIDWDTEPADTPIARASYRSTYLINTTGALGAPA